MFELDEQNKIKTAVSDIKLYMDEAEYIKDIPSLI